MMKLRDVLSSGRPGGGFGLGAVLIVSCASLNSGDPPPEAPPSAAAASPTADSVEPSAPALASAKDRPILAEGSRLSVDDAAESNALPAAGAPSAFAERRASESLDQLSGTVEIRHEKRGAVITLPCDKLVDPGQSALTFSGRMVLDNLGRGLRDQEGHAILVQGYTDSLGSSTNNDALSLLRAEAVRDYLITRGVPKERIRAEGLGARRPLASNETADDRAKNRRIEIIIVR